jgi:transposase-like protein
MALTVRNGGREQLVYSETEAKHAGVEYVYWRDLCGKPRSGWVLTDDGFVVYARWQGGAFKFHHSIAGKFHCGRQMLLLTADHIDKKSPTGNKNYNSRDYALLVAMLRAFLYFGIKPRDFLSLFFERVDDKFVKLMSRKEAVGLMNKEITAVAKELGIDEAWILSKWKQEVEVADSSKDRQAALKELGDILNIKGKASPNAIDAREVFKLNKRGEFVRSLELRRKAMISGDAEEVMGALGEAELRELSEEMKSLDE